jgi:hypothetical protein
MGKFTDAIAEVGWERVPQPEIFTLHRGGYEVTISKSEDCDYTWEWQIHTESDDDEDDEDDGTDTWVASGQCDEVDEEHAQWEAMLCALAVLDVIAPKR